MIAESLTWLYTFTMDLVRTFGPVGVIIAMVIQAIFVIIPSEAVMTLAGASLGFASAVVYGFIGELLGAVTAFLIASKLGKPFVKKIVPSAELNSANEFTKKFGAHAVLIGRLLPFVPFDAISYVSGLTAIPFSKFMLATAVGAFPRALFYSYIGVIASLQMEKEGIESMFSFLMIVAAVLVLMLFLGKKAFDKYVLKKHR